MYPPIHENLLPELQSSTSDNEVSIKLKKIMIDYGISFGAKDSTNELANKLHRGLNEIVNFLIENIRTQPANINRLQTLLV